MKRTIIVLLFLIGGKSFAQNLSLAELLVLQSSSLSEINDNLLSKSWTLINSHQDKEINPSHFKDNAWTISAGTWEYYSDNVMDGRIEYQYNYRFTDTKKLIHDDSKMIRYVTFDRDQYLSIKISLASRGYVKYDEDFGENIIQVSYRNDTHIVRLSSHSPKNSNPFFIIHVLNKVKLDKKQE